MQDAEFYQLSFHEGRVILIKPYRSIYYQKLEDGRKMKERKMNYNLSTRLIIQYLGLF